MDPTERRRLGSSPVSVSVLGCGGAALGGLYEAVSENEARATLDRAFELGVRWFDTAPLYGFGQSERRVGGALRPRPRRELTISTKVGRLLRAEAALHPDYLQDGEPLFHGDSDVRPVYDYGRRGVATSLEESLERLGLQRVDVLFLHDPDEHERDAVDEALPELQRLRRDGRVGAIGVGMNQSAMPARFVEDFDLDVVLLAGRYTLLDQSGLADLLPACERRGTAVVVGGVYNSGVLADPDRTARFDYAPAPDEVAQRARALRDVCAQHGVPLKAAALQFPLAHPAVAAVLMGPRSVQEVEENVRLFEHPLPSALWDDLRDRGLLLAKVPTP